MYVFCFLRLFSFLSIVFVEKGPNDVFIIELNARICVSILILTLNRKIWCLFSFNFSKTLYIYVCIYSSYSVSLISKEFVSWSNWILSEEDLLTFNHVWFIDLLFCWPVMIVFNMVDWKASFYACQFVENHELGRSEALFNWIFAKFSSFFRFINDFFDVGCVWWYHIC